MTENLNLYMYFEKLLNPNGNPEARLVIPNTHTYIPILDDPITPMEVDNAIKRIKPNKCSRA